MDEPQAEQLVETLDHCGAPRAAGGADTSQAWYQLRARKRATFAKKIVIPSLIPRALPCRARGVSFQMFLYLKHPPVTAIGV